MRNLIKISLITSMLLTSVYAFDPTDQIIIDGQRNDINANYDEIEDTVKPKLDEHETRLNNNDTLNNTQNTRITNLENDKADKTDLTALQNEVNDINNQSFPTEEYVDDLISDVDDEIYGWIDSSTTTTNALGQTIITERESEDTIYATLNGQTQTVFNTDTGELISETTIKKGLIQLSEENITKDNQQDTDIANNNTLANSAFTNANTAVNKADVNSSDITTIKAKNTAQDVQISNIDNRVTINADKDIAQDVVINQAVNNINIEKSRNDNQDIQITNLQSNKADKSEVVLVNNRVDNNESRLDDKDIKDSQQDTQINSNTNRITVVEHNVSTLISNSNTQVNNRLDKQDRKISKLEEALAKTDKRENKKIASGMATNLNFDFTNGDRSFAMNHSNFNGENALGVGYAYRKNGTTISISLGTDFENVGVKTQASFSF